MIETTGEGKSAVATPDGKSRQKKKKLRPSSLSCINEYLAIDCGGNVSE